MSSDPVKPKVPAANLPLPCGPAEVDAFVARPQRATVAAVRQGSGPVLVLGAGGKMGLHLSLMLRQAIDQAGRRDPVIAVSRFRSLHDREAFTRHGVETRICDLEIESELARLPEAPTVFFLAGVKFGTADEPNLLRRMNEEMPRKVAARFKTSRFVAFSTGCVYPFVAPSTGGADESIPPRAAAGYAASCLARESVFRQASTEHGTQSVLIRLNYAVELRYGLLVDIAQRVAAGEPVDVAMGYANVIWQGDALNYAIRALALAAAPAIPLNLTGPEILSTRATAVRFGELLGREPIVTGTEAETAWLNDARRLFGLFGKPQVSADAMIPWIAAWIARGGECWGKPTGFERRDGKF